MAEILVDYRTRVRGSDERVYRARACGGEAQDGTARWQGWIEFVPVDGGTVIRFRRETTQPNRTDLEYWATGLTDVYIEGALERTLNPPAKRAAAASEPPAFDGPAPESTLPLPGVASVLNPFSVYDKGDFLLRRQLAALSSWHLVNIIRAYKLSDADERTLKLMPATDLIELIATVVRDRVRAFSS